MKENNIVVALDFAEKKPLLDLVSQLDPSLCRLKIGKEVFTRFGPALVKEVADEGFDVFLDLKFHDIPNTVAKAVASAADLGVWMVNVHAQGGRKMMEAAVNELQAFGSDAPLLIAVTVLTSMGADDLADLGFSDPASLVSRLALLAKSSGMDGVVSSAQEAHMIKSQCAADFVTVTPGIRPEGSNSDDQKRILTPSQAVEQGADYLVIGRPITQHASPLSQLEAIHASLSK